VRDRREWRAAKEEKGGAAHVVDERRGRLHLGFGEGPRVCHGGPGQAKI
jgi:hypothetical protein